MTLFQRKEIIGPITLYQADCLSLMPTLGEVGHFIMDPPYEAITHAAKASTSKLRSDGGGELKALDFGPIDPIREDVVEFAKNCRGWFLAFCTAEGVRPWADAINAADFIKYKRACTWVKPDSAPQMNGQCPASGTESFVAAWAGSGFSRWNAGGKRGVYIEPCNPRNRHGLHPTEKPLKLMQQLVLDFTDPGDLVADAFMGTGATMVACALAGRRGIGIEANTKYFDAAVLRVRRAVEAASQGFQVMSQADLLGDVI